MNAAATTNPRQLAISALADVLDRGINLTDCPSLQDGRKSRDLSMSRHLAYGVLRWLTALEWLANRLLSKPLKQRDLDIYRLILLGLYQLWQDETAEHAAVHETAECARLGGKPWAVGLINAILRRFQRERHEWLDKLADQPERFAHPRWMLETLQHDWPDHWQAIVAANNQQAPMWLRINRKEHDRREITEKLEDQGFEVRSHPSAADAISISPAVHVSALAGFAEGYFSVQDPATQLAAGLLDVHAGMHVLDACAAPGGKTCHILEHNPAALVTALDLSAHRNKLIQQNLDRLKLSCKLLVGDAAKPGEWWDGVAFQRILLDAPCSATGVIRRHPDIKHLRKPAQVQEAIQTQQRILRSLWPLLEPGGILVYATCSLFKDENCERINSFLGETPDARECTPDVRWGHRQQPGVQIFPGEQDMDGFYYAVLRKNS
jgi:16S rRNA (cytosine967-C5)-methyltransferase